MESTMKLTLVVVCLKVSFQSIKVISAQRVPKIFSPTCKENVPTELPSNCCDIPDLFDMETLEGCSDAKPVQDLALRGSPECAERTCLLRNNDLLFDNDEIDIESVRQYLDEWVQKRREFQGAVETCKYRCLGKRRLFGPLEMCPADKLLLCINSSFFNKCPDWRNTESCRNLRTYLESCFPYYD